MNLTLPRMPWQKNGNGSDSRESVESELKPGERPAADRRRAEALAREVRRNPKARKLTELMTRRFETACSRRRSWESEAILSCAMYEGRQWLRWDDKLHQALSLMAEKEKARYVTHNLVCPLTDKVVALATMTKADATPAAQTTARIDRKAAEEARAIVADRSRAYGGYTETRKVAFWAAKTGVGYLKHCWLPKRMVPIPIYENGELVGRKAAPLGLEERRVINPFELLLDADALVYEDAGHIFHACMMPLSWFEDTYGELGKAVEPTAKGQMGTTAGQAYLSGSWGGVGQLDYYCRDGRQALCLEMWEKPTPTYQEGRYAVLGNDLLMTDPDEVLPYNQLIEGQKTIPFSRMVYREAQNHGYGRGLIADLCTPQIEINRLLTKAVTAAEDAKVIIYRSKRDGAGADLGEMLEAGRSEFRNRLEIMFNFGSDPPKAEPMPSILGDILPIIDRSWGDMQHIAGVHDVSMGGAPPGVTAGIAIALAQDGDRTQHAHFTGNIEHFAYQRDTTSIALHAQKLDGHFERLMGLDESGNPDEAQAQAQAFTALTNGGAVDVVVVPGSATPRTAAGKRQEIYELIDKGLLDPANPQAEMAMRLLAIPETDQVLEHFERIKAEQAAAMQAEQAAIAKEQEAVAAAQEGELAQQGQDAEIQAQAQVEQEAVRQNAALEQTRMKGEQSAQQQERQLAQQSTLAQQSALQNEEKMRVDLVARAMDNLARLKQQASRGKDT